MTSVNVPPFKTMHTGRPPDLVALFAICLLFWLLFPATAWPQDEPQKNRWTLSLYWENDLFGNTDRDYSNGLKFTWSRPFDNWNPVSDDFHHWASPLFKRLPFMHDAHAMNAISYSLGQDIYTPEDTSSSELIVDDRPYAGYAYLGTGLHSRKGDRRDVWELIIGVVGPLSYAQELQDFVHDVVDAPHAQGWDHQLKNELALEAIWESKWRVWNAEAGSGFGFDFIPHLGARLGNVAIYANTGAEFRAGWYVPNNFGSCTLRPGCDIGTTLDRRMDGFRDNRNGVHFFAGFDGRLVLRDIFLDGNTFQDSHSVKKENLVADLFAGIAATYGRLGITYAYVLRTREFKQRDDPLIFGALTFSWAF